MTRWTTLVGMILLASHTAAQFKNIKIDSAALDSKLTNPSITIVKKDGPALAACAMGSLYLSSDGGKTWKKSKAPGSGRDKILISDGKGTLFVIEATAGNGRKSQILCTSSRDEGKTFDDGVVIANVQGKDQAVPSASMDAKGNLFVTWTQFDKFQSADSACRSLIFLASLTNGKKWNKPVEISQFAGNCLADRHTAIGGTTVIGPDGKMFAAWCNGAKIYMDRSFGNAIWLQNDIFVGNVTPGWDLVIPGHAQPASMPELLVDQGKGPYKGCLYLSWADQRNGASDTDVWFMRSNNHGDNWSSPLRMGEVVAAKHQYAPKMTVDSSTGYIYILFYDRGPYENNETNVSLAYSTDSGGSFKNVTISETPFVPDDKTSMGRYLSITAANGVIVPIWSRMDDAETSLWTATIKQEDLVKPASAVKSKKKK